MRVAARDSAFRFGAKGSDELQQASQPRSQRRSRIGFEPNRVFGPKSATENHPHLPGSGDRISDAIQYAICIDQRFPYLLTDHAGI